MKQLFEAFLRILGSFLAGPRPDPVIPAPIPVHTVPEAPVSPVAPPLPSPAPIPPKLSWRTAPEAYLSTRILCDEYGLSLANKNIICACIYQESNFLNYLRPGVPTKFENRDEATGRVWSTDWGICQINDTKGWHIGPGLPFPSVQYVLDNPEKAVRYMIRMFQKGKLSLWSSYKFGHYKKWLKPGSPMWALKK